MGDEKLGTDASSARWGTWEELLLASAVNRHGSDNWDSVSMEVSSKTSLPRLLTSPDSCELKYQDLHRRFIHLDVPWLDHLRKLRVAELRRDLRRYDLSILALQSKVKRLEEERERSLSEEPKPEGENPDLGSKRQRSSNEETRSGNGSNSTEEGERAADPVRAKEEDVQSSASLGKKGRRTGDPIAGGVAVKSEPLVGLLEMIRAHAHGSLFERRLEAQESKKYTDTVRQHMDLETIQRRLNDGSYASSAVCLHRDLLLLFTNAVVFFPPNSLHSLAAHQLRALLLDHIHKQVQPPSRPLPQPKPELEKSDSLLARQKSSAPLIVCRKRTRTSSTPSSAPREDPERTPTPPVVEPAAPNKLDKPVTGARSSRRNNSRKGKISVVGGSTASPPGAPISEDEKQKTPKTEKKKKRESASAPPLDKRRSAADFLKRIKKNSPAKKSEQRKSHNNNNSNNGKEAAGKGSNKKQEAASPTKKNGGRAGRKTAGDQQTAASGKRGKEVAAKESGRQPRKRARK